MLTLRSVYGAYCYRHSFNKPHLLESLLAVTACLLSVPVMQSTHLLCRQKETAAANRKDSKLKAVVISEAWDKKSSKYNSPSVPFPFDSKVTYEQSMRTPMGREYNTTAAHR